MPMKSHTRELLNYLCFGLIALLAGTARTDLTLWLMGGILVFLSLAFFLMLSESAGMRWTATAPAAFALLLIYLILPDSLLWLLPVLLATAVHAQALRKARDHSWIPMGTSLLAGVFLVVFLSPPSRNLPIFLLAGHLALLFMGMTLLSRRGDEQDADAAAASLPLEHFIFLAFFLLGTAMTILKFYPVLEFLPLVLGTGAALYNVLTRPESHSRSGRTYLVICGLFGLLLVADRFIQAMTR